MSNKFQLKRTSISGRTPNTTNQSNTSFIDAGELAVNLADKKLFSSNGVTSFEVGGNLSSLNVSGIATINAISANGSVGTTGQMLASNGTSLYWKTPELGDITSITAGTGLSGGGTTGDVSIAVNTSYLAALTVNNSTYFDGASWAAPKAIGGGTANGGTFTSLTATSNLNISSTASLYANGSAGTTGQVLTSNGSTAYWADSTGGGAAFTPTVSQVFTANGTANSFGLTGTTSAINALVSINGVLQTPTTDYGVASGNTVVFTFNPANGDIVEVRYGNQPISSFSPAVYTYNITSNTSVITGGDANGGSLLYVSGLESVFINGVKQVAGADYTRTSNTSVTLASNAVNGDVVEVVAVLESTIVTNYEDGSNTYAASSTSAVVVDSFLKTQYRTCKWHIQITDNANSAYHATEFFMIHNGTTTFDTEYATIYSGVVSLGTVSSNINGSMVELVVTPTYANTTIKTKRYTIEV